MYNTPTLKKKMFSILSDVYYEHYHEDITKITYGLKC